MSLLKKIIRLSGFGAYDSDEDRSPQYDPPSPPSVQLLPTEEQGDDQNEGSVIDANGEDDIGERDAVSVTRNNRSSGDSGKKTIDVERWSQDEPDKSAHSTSPVKVTITKVDSPRQSTVTVTRKSEIVMTRSTPAGERLDRYSVRVPRVDRTDSPDRPLPSDPSVGLVSLDSPTTRGIPADGEGSPITTPQTLQSRVRIGGPTKAAQAFASTLSNSGDTPPSNMNIVEPFTAGRPFTPLRPPMNVAEQEEELNPSQSTLLCEDTSQGESAEHAKTDSSPVGVYAKIVNRPYPKWQHPSALPNKRKAAVDATTCLVDSHSPSPGLQSREHTAQRRQDMSPSADNVSADGSPPSENNESRMPEISVIDIEPQSLNSPTVEPEDVITLKDLISTPSSSNTIPIEDFIVGKKYNVAFNPQWRKRSRNGDDSVESDARPKRGNTQAE